MPDFRDIAKWFEEFEMQLIQSLKRNLGRHESEEKAQAYARAFSILIYFINKSFYYFTILLFLS